MQTKNPQYNIYALLKQKPKVTIYFLFFLVFLGIILFCFFFRVHGYLSLQGMYDCQNNKCFVMISMPYSHAKRLKEQNEIQIENKKYPLKVKEFGKIEVLETSPWQTVTLEVPKLDYFGKETIEIQIIESEKSLVSIFVDTLKGGEAS